MTDFFTKARTFYSNLEPARQTQLWLAAAAVLVTIIGISWWMSTEPYSQIPFASVEDMREAAAELRKEGIPTRVEGTTLSVPTSEVGNAEGVIGTINRKPGMGDINDVPVGTSPTAFRWARIRQQEGDLARQIATIPGVLAAFVKLTPGERSLFVDEPDTPGKASVALQVSATTPPGQDAARAIAAMVANSRSDLEPSFVAITDSLGRVLQDGQGDAGGDGLMSRDLLALKRGYEAEVEAKLSRHLRSLVGMDNAFMVAATAEVEHQSREVRSTDYNVDKVFAAQESLNEEAREKNEPAAEGAPGVDGELPERNADANAPAGGMNKEDKTRIQKSNVAPSTTEVTIIPAGALKALAVSVSINEARLAEVWGITPEDAAWADKLATLDSHLRTAVATMDAQQVEFSLMATPFAEIPLEEAPTVTVDGVLGRVAPFVPYAIAAVALLLAFLFVVRPLMAQVAKAPLPKLTDASQEEMVGPDGKPLNPGSEDEEDLVERVKKIVENFQPVDKEDLNKLVEQQSDATAKVIRDWIQQGA